MMHVAAFTSGVHVPSARFRVRQFIDELSRHDVAVKEYISPMEKYGKTYPPGIFYKVAARVGGDPLKWWLQYKNMQRYPQVWKSRSADITWLERILIPEHLTLEKKLKKPLVFDLDDAIWLPDTEGAGFLHEVVAHADLVFAGNAYLADWCSTYQKNIRIVPTAVDTAVYRPKQRTETTTKIFGWIGSPSNYPYLEAIMPALLKVLDAMPNSELHICSSKPFPSSHSRMRFVQWHPEQEVSFIQGLDVGLMPLADDAWTRGKCSYKLLQYLSCGIPAVVAPVGMNNLVIQQLGTDLTAKNQAEWQEQLLHLLSDDNQRTDLGQRGRQLIEMNYAVTVIAQHISSYFKTLL